MNELKFLSVSDINTIFSNIFRAETMLHNINILGEVSRIKIYGAHSYFTIKDENAELSCSCFNYSKTYVPQMGEKIFVTGSPNFYAQKGTLTFVASAIKPAGTGEMHIKLEELKAKLKAEGLFDDSHKKPIPRFSRNVGVITSINGAVIRDIATTIRKVNDLIDIKIFDARVQGQGASTTINNALIAIDELGYDVIIIARGGGSFEDLMPFNDEILARTIYNAKTPIISAIGHETDFTICDFVSDIRVATPTAAGELVAYNVEELKLYIQRVLENISNITETVYNKYTRKLIDNMSRLSYKIDMINSNNSIQLSGLLSRLDNGIHTKYNKSQSNLDIVLSKLDSINPIKLLKGGYYRVMKGTKSIFSIQDVSINDKIEIIGTDGRIKAIVDEIELER